MNNDRRDELVQLSNLKKLRENEASRAHVIGHLVAELRFLEAVSELADPDSESAKVRVCRSIWAEIGFHTVRELPSIPFEKAEGPVS